ncbi:MAG: NAD-dependent epimerase/dehydratase family protein [Muribaculaceae bacterium]|nr:NAD-dependent epimerase/dehydratase family protein [Muribaculaceae bacterium]
MKVLIAGGAGFIGSALGASLADSGNDVLCVDVFSDYYTPALKKSRLVRDGFRKEDIEESIRSKGIIISSTTKSGLRFVCADICNESDMSLMHDFNPDVVVNLAAQPGVRYSQVNPEVVIKTNVLGFFNLIESARKAGVSRFIYASSSSVYGDNVAPPFRETDKCDDPLSVYASTKICDEAIAAAYSNSYGLNTVGVRMFSVYGPWGRPDMAPLIFAHNIVHDERIELYGGGLQTRDYTYIDDVVESLRRLVMLSGMDGEHEIYNIGSCRPVPVVELLRLIERKLRKHAIYEAVPEQKGEARRTLADTARLLAATGYSPDTSLEDGIEEMLKWYMTMSVS